MTGSLKVRRWLQIGLVLLIASGCAQRADWIEGTLVTVDATGRWAGTWERTWFEIILRQTGARVEGDVRMLGDVRPRLDGPITGTVRGDVLTFARSDGRLRGEFVVAGDEMSGTITLATTPRPQDKAGDGRWVALNRIAVDALRAVKRDQRVMSPYVFCSPEGRFLHNFERYWRRALRAAALADFRFHDCRHTFASRLALAGTDLYTVQRAGGWKSQSMVQRYAHLSPDHIKAAVERLAATSAVATGTKTGTAG